MGRLSKHELRRLGISSEDLDLARSTQDAQRRTGSPVQSIGALVGVTEARPSRSIAAPASPASLTDRALRRRGTYDQAALLLDQQALQESSPERAEKARLAAQAAKELSAARQIEFDFLGRGNMGIGFQFHDEVTSRLRSSGETLAKQHQAIAVLFTIARHLAWQSHECSKTAAELSELTGVKPSHMADTLALLERVGAIQRVRRGRSKVITVTPEGAFRGSVHEHGKAVERYRLEVIEGGPERS